MENTLTRSVKVFVFLIFISGFLVTQSVVAQNEPQIKNGENTLSIKSGNQTRQYILFIPADYDRKDFLPLVFLFHGTGGTSKSIMQATEFSKIAEKNKFSIVAPDGIYPFMGKNSWNAELDKGGVSDIELVRDLIREISSKVNIDQKRIYATGFSAGARLSSRLVCEASTSNVVAAIGAVAGLQFPGDCTTTRPVPVIVFHGTADILYHQGLEFYVSGWVQNNGCNKTPITKKISEDVTQFTYGECKSKAEVVFYRINNGGHTWPDSPFADFYEKLGMGKTNKDINATNLIWRFFEAHPLP